MTSECDAMRETMSELLDNRPGAEDRRRLLAHLEGCRACQLEWDSLRAVDELLSGAAMVSPAAGFTVRFQARLAARRRQRRRTAIGLVLLAAVTALLVWLGVSTLVAFGLLFWQGAGVWAPSLLEHGVDSLSVLARAAENSIGVALVVWRAMSRLTGHPYFLSSASLTLLLTAAWVWIVGTRFRASRLARA